MLASVPSCWLSLYRLRFCSYLRCQLGHTTYISTSLHLNHNYQITEMTQTKMHFCQKTLAKGEEEERGGLGWRRDEEAERVLEVKVRSKEDRP